MIGIPGLSIPRRRRRASFTGAYDAVPSIVAAYGMRRLRSAYTGSLLRMRRSSDNAESDFGYTAAGHLDTAAIVAWLSGSGYIVKWYDQSGNGYDATQSTAASQPLYVASGQNGRPVLRWDGVDDYLSNGAYSVSQPVSTVATAKFSGSPNDNVSSILFDSTDAGNRITLYKASSATPDGWALWAGAEVVGGTADTNWHVFSGVASGISSGLFLDASSIAAGDFGSNTMSGITIGARYTETLLWNGDIAELIICNAALSTGDRQAAETAANDYWSIY